MKRKARCCYCCVVAGVICLVACNIAVGYLNYRYSTDKLLRQEVNYLEDETKTVVRKALEYEAIAKKRTKIRPSDEVGAVDSAKESSICLLYTSPSPRD